MTHYRTPAQIVEDMKRGVKVARGLDQAVAGVEQMVRSGTVPPGAVAKIFSAALAAHEQEYGLEEAIARLTPAWRDMTTAAREECPPAIQGLFPAEVPRG